MILAVTGATGFVGQAVVDRALVEGFALRALARRRQPERKRTQWVSGQLDAPDSLRALMRGSDVVLHLAGVVKAVDAAAFDAGNVHGTLNLIEACKAEGVQRLIFVSSLSAREPALSAYGASKARAEKLVMASGLDWTIVRPPGIYGPRDRDYFEMFRMARWGVVPVPPRGGRSSIIHVGDLARLLLALVPSDEAVTAATFEPDDGRQSGWDHHDLARTIGWAVGRRPWVVPLSRRWLERAARIDHMIRGNRARLTPDRVGYMTHPDWVISDSARPPASLWQAEIPTRQGLKATARWYHEAGWL